MLADLAGQDDAPRVLVYSMQPEDPYAVRCLRAACGRAEQETTPEMAQVTAAQTECRNDARQFAYCVNQANLIGLATCNAGETRTTYSLLGACSASTYHTITWTCCPQ